VSSRDESGHESSPAEDHSTATSSGKSLFVEAERQGEAIVLTPVYAPVEAACASFYFYLWGNEASSSRPCDVLNLFIIVMEMAMANSKLAIAQGQLKEYRRF
jgi:hypothetical protein